MQRKYNEASLEAALAKIRNESYSLRRASKEFGVPVTTLHDRIRGKIGDGIPKMGPATVLSESEEQKIVDWLINLAKCGFPQKPDELLDVVQKIVRDEKRKTPFKNDRPGKKWYYSFFKRHKELSLHTPETISKARAIITEQNIRKWFRDLEEYLNQENWQDILQDPSRIFNGDETSFSLAPKTGLVIGPKGYRNNYQIKFSNEKDNLTVLLVFNASGKTLPPVVVFPYLRPPAKLVNSMPKDWIVGRSETGWMRSETFYEYVANDFNEWLNINNIKRPILFLVDGHKSHLSMQVSEFCCNNNIILYALPPNTTHIMQPADVGAFKGLKHDYKETVRKWNNLPENFGKSVNKSNFCEILKLVLDKTDRTEIVQNSFKKCGLYPFNPNAVDYTKCVQNNLELLNKSAGLDTENSSYLTVENLKITKNVLLALTDELVLKNMNLELLLEIISHEEEKLKYNKAPNEADIQDNIVIQARENYNEVNFQQTPTSSDTIYINETFQETIDDILNDDVVIPCSSSTIELSKVAQSDTTYTNENLQETIDDILNDDVVIPCSSSTIELSKVAQSDTTYTNENLQETIDDILNADVVLMPCSSRTVIDGARTFTSEIFIDSTNITPINSPASSKINSANRRLNYSPSSKATDSPKSTSSFDKHLKYPEPLKTKKGRILLPENRPPMSISAEKWREFYKNQEKTKELRRTEIDKRKEEKLAKNVKKNVKKTKPIPNKTKKQTVLKKTNRKELCGACEDELDTDTEEDLLKNIGCDKCNKWYHLGCTKLSTKSFNEAQKEEFICNFCIPIEIDAI